MENFELRENQKKVIEETADFFRNNNKDIYLWAIKCRWGKTFAAYNLAKSFYSNKPLKILILTYKPTVSKEWKDNLTNHIYFKDWKYYTKENKKSFLKSTAPVSVLFMSFQSMISKDGAEFKFKSDYYKWIGDVDFDFLFVDEAHYGASNPYCIDFCKNKIKANYRLFMSGTPFTAVQNKLFNYYSAYDCTDEDSDLNVYLAKSKNNWITTRDFLKTTEYKHIILYMADIPSCQCMSSFLKNNGRFKVINCFCSSVTGGDAMIQHIQDEIRRNEKTVTITCGMAMTGTTIPQWDCILFFGCDRKHVPDSPSTFFQTLFRITTKYKDKKIAAYYFDDIVSLIYKYKEYANCISATKRIDNNLAFKNLLNSIPIIYNGDKIGFEFGMFAIHSEEYKSYVSWYKQSVFLACHNYDEEVA